MKHGRLPGASACDTAVDVAPGGSRRWSAVCAAVAGPPRSQLPQLLQAGRDTRRFL